MNANLESIQPTDYFSESIIANRLTKAVYIAKNADGVTFEVTNNLDGSSVTFYTNGQWHPIRINAAITLADHTIVYAY